MSASQAHAPATSARQVVVVADGSSNMEPYWKSLYETCLYPALTVRAHPLPRAVTYPAVRLGMGGGRSTTAATHSTTLYPSWTSLFRQHGPASLPRRQLRPLCNDRLPRSGSMSEGRTIPRSEQSLPSSHSTITRPSVTVCSGPTTSRPSCHCLTRGPEYFSLLSSPSPTPPSPSPSPPHSTLSPPPPP